MTIYLRPLSREEVRQLDRRAVEELTLPGLLLMENAGRAAAAWLAELAGNVPSDGGSHHPPAVRTTQLQVPPLRPDSPKVVVLCGPGNNGGDGGVVTRHLDAWGFSVRIVWFARSGSLGGDAATQWRILEKSGVDQVAWYDVYSGEPEAMVSALEAVLAGADWVVDGLLGTGLSRPVEGTLRTVIDTMNRCGKPILSLDVPSGLDADSGVPLGVAVRARATATFVAPKLGFSHPAAVEYTGEVAVIDIGLPRCLLSPFRVP